ncbi:helix-turn-helix domain-containing protein [Pelosinus sp. Bkl1]|uniref:Helix-turn-helix domain-containing protein n=2 Tax=Pelosinus baikalensis TaxID=2892015 RepID=A0ABS8HQD7_9FIRM|nr:helix-turn-helix domain-containing protein [Pelosinus baikalensis]
MGTTSVDERIKDYMHTLGLDFSRPLICCLLVSKDFIGREKEQNNIIEVLGNEKGCIVWNCRNDIGVLYQGGNAEHATVESSMMFAHALLEKIYQYDSQLKLVLGISNVQTGLNSVRKTYWQGWSATVAAQCQGKEDGIFHYKDLGILQLLVKNIGNEGAKEFVKEQIGTLIRYDEEKGTNLVTTLEEILQHSNLKKTAEKMFLHPKTVVFRKQRIEKILGVSLDSFETRLALGVALKLHLVNQVIKVHN